ncbi:hypothetical protein HU200_052569 [Digitaria exilis]|uniref:Reverse transcriptase zinc-binding domain-containing protein n=1 Tax=Digitaria exilis TaxID=1010633 RepID=A0A835AP02_9POAL|nr:hypothetical protein HU200_052569 [Digitaria exilis]
MMLHDYNCDLRTHSLEESREQLFLQCPFVQSSWQILHLQISTPNDPYQTLIDLRAQLNVSFFMDVIVLVCWSIWLAGNIQPTLEGCRQHFKKEFAYT